MKTTTIITLLVGVLFVLISTTAHAQAFENWDIRKGSSSGVKHAKTAVWGERLNELGYPLTGMLSALGYTCRGPNAERLVVFYSNPINAHVESRRRLNRIPVRINVDGQNLSTSFYQESGSREMFANELDTELLSTRFSIANSATIAVQWHGKDEPALFRYDLSGFSEAVGEAQGHCSR